MKLDMVFEPRDLEFKTRLMQYKIKILQPTFGPFLGLREPHVGGLKYKCIA
jgi:hypothetical protein